MPVKQRQVAIGRILFAAMSGNLLGASGAGIIADLFGWRSVFFVTAASACSRSPWRSRLPWHAGTARPLRLVDARSQTTAPIFAIRSRRYCFGAVFIEAIFMFGLFPYMATLLHAEGDTQASIAGIVIAGFGVGGIVYTMTVSWLILALGDVALDGGRRHDHGVLPGRDRATRAVAGRVR